MMTEELTIDGVTAELNAWVNLQDNTTLQPPLGWTQKQQASYTTGVFQFSKPW
jgi:hypothetical protein